MYLIVIFNKCKSYLLLLINKVKVVLSFNNNNIYNNNNLNICHLINVQFNYVVLHIFERV